MTKDKPVKTVASAGINCHLCISIIILPFNCVGGRELNASTISV